MPPVKMAPAAGGTPVTTVTTVSGEVTLDTLTDILETVEKTANAEATETSEETCPTGSECSTQVIKKIVVTVVHRFVVACDSLPKVADYEKTYAAAMGVTISDVAIEIVSETGCDRRLLANGERRLQSGTQEVSAGISYPDTEEGKAAVVAVVQQDSSDLETMLTAKLESEAQIIAAVATVSAKPEVGIETEVAVLLSQAPTSAPTLETEEPTPATAEPTVQPTMATESPTLAPSNATEAPTNLTEEESRAALTGAGLVTVAVAAFSLISTAL